MGKTTVHACKCLASANVPLLQQRLAVWLSSHCAAAQTPCSPTAMFKFAIQGWRPTGWEVHSDWGGSVS